MAAVRLDNIVKRFGAVEVLRGIDLAIAEGEFVVFVGPSGCGKSTLLRTIAGLEEPSAGRVLIGDTDVTHAAPPDRGIAMVFQSYALYPQMSVAENMGFALKLAGLPRAEIAARVGRAAATLGITELLERRPRELSGGQRQRVAIGRAIVREPKVFLFDEPLSNLDAALRHRMRYEFAGLHRTLGATMIYVTHDQVEAMTLADRIVVLNGGVIEQVGAPMDLYEHPASRFVAGFIGAPGMNFIEGVIERVEGTRAVVAVTGDSRIEVACDASSLATGAPVAVGMRPEDMRLTEGEGIAGIVRFVELLGGGGFAYIDVSGQAEALTCAVDMAEAPVAGARVRLTADPERLHLFDGDGRALPRTVARTPRAAA